jgi:hypothetical protein
MDPSQLVSTWGIYLGAAAAAIAILASVLAIIRTLRKKAGHDAAGKRLEAKVALRAPRSDDVRDRNLFQ